MNISNRLKKIADFVPKNAKIVDIGTDHAYIPVFLAKRNLISSAIASDINKGPLKTAKWNIENNNVEDIVNTRLSDGLKNISKKDGNTLIIAGMGGMLIKDILDYNLEKTKSFKTLILQPQRDVYQLRKYLNSIDYKIIKEDIVLENKKFYFILMLEKGNQKLSEIEYKFGKYNIDNKNNILVKFLNENIKRYTKIKKDLENENTNVTKTRIKEINLKLQEYQEVLNEIKKGD